MLKEIIGSTSRPAFPASPLGSSSGYLSELAVGSPGLSRVLVAGMHIYGLIGVTDKSSLAPHEGEWVQLLLLAESPGQPGLWAVLSAEGLFEVIDMSEDLREIALLLRDVPAEVPDVEILSFRHGAFPGEVAMIGLKSKGEELLREFLEVRFRGGGDGGSLFPSGLPHVRLRSKTSGIPPVPRPPLGGGSRARLSADGEEKFWVVSEPGTYELGTRVNPGEKDVVLGSKGVLFTPEGGQTIELIDQRSEATYVKDRRALFVDAGATPRGGEGSGEEADLRTLPVLFDEQGERWRCLSSD